MNGVYFLQEQCNYFTIDSNALNMLHYNNGHTVQIITKLDSLDPA
jgi:hypothetical protein